MCTASPPVRPWLSRRRPGGSDIEKLALYEAPFIVDDTRPPLAEDYSRQLDTLLASDRRGDAVRLFMRQVGLPGLVIALMRFMPAWSKLKGVAHTLPYDAAAMSGTQAGKPLPAKRWDAATLPTLVVVGGKSPAWMHRGMQALVDLLPNARLSTLEGQTHMVKPKALAPLLVEFFNGGDARPAEDHVARPFARS